MTESNEVKTKAAQMIQNYCKEIGINMEVKTADTALFDNYKYDFSEWDLKLDNNLETVYPSQLFTPTSFPLPIQATTEFRQASMVFRKVT